MEFMDYFRSDARLRVVLEQGSQSPAGGLARTLAACFEELHPDVQAALAENLTIVARESQRRLNSHRTPANFLYW
ncbi:hypothetical protein [Corynebacterium phoceense]|uniref:hypothetical protein n=1 Tax=Corynebacterium phoceense TaxID=1686286 RepID=UPI00211C1D98|nr:hypothetical protein [Corynebacterium phoceense]MCQ9345013.1 hypothetical protein [Corynebacterium phoceense]